MCSVHVVGHVPLVQIAADFEERMKERHEEVRQQLTTSVTVFQSGNHSFPPSYHLYIVSFWEGRREHLPSLWSLTSKCTM